MKKKLVIKKTSKTGSISVKIAEKQKKSKSSKIAQELTQKDEPVQSGLTEKQTATSEKHESEKIKLKFAQRSELTPTERRYSKGTGKSYQKEKEKSNLREEILKKEDHKKFFISQQVKKKQGTFDPHAERSSIPKEIKITEFIQIGALAKKLNVKTSSLITKLMQMGEMVTITQSIDADTAILVAEEFGCKAGVISLYDETVITEESDFKADLITRPPVVTIMGHVDHGKTKLLDMIRKTDIITQEAGGITQHIGAYQVSTPKGDITFLDTPGHEAFTAMRARGAMLTDIVVLVVAVDDGVMPQTIEAIQHTKEAKVPIIVAVNKIDVAETDFEKVRQELSQHGLVPEEWGGDTSFIKISALKGTNIDELKNQILAQAEMLELKADPRRRAVGITVEARLDQGRGAMATILVQNGTLKMGDCFIVGMEGGRVKAMFNSHGKKLKESRPSTPVEILGFSGVPQVGDPFHVMESEKEMKDIIRKRQELNRQQQAQQIRKVKLETLDDAIQEGKVKQLKIIIKADVRGSVEAIQTSLEKLSNEEVSLNVILTGTGEVSESDVMLASTANAIIIGFNVRANSKVRTIAEKEGVSIFYFSIIYEVIDKLKEAMEGMLSPDIKEEILGEAEVRELFKISSVGTIAGCKVGSGTIKRNSGIRVIRDGTQIHESYIQTLKRFKEDVAEVKEGFECGILVANFNDVKVGDALECFEKKQFTKTLEEVQISKGKEKKTPLTPDSDSDE